MSDADLPRLECCIKCGAPVEWQVPFFGDDTLYILCGCGMYMDTSDYDSLDEAAREWNRRPYIDGLLRRIAEQEAARP